MPKLASRILCLLAALGASLAVAPAAQAADQAFSTRYAATVRGDVRTVGNTSMSCTGAGCTNARNGTGGNLDNNDWDMVDVDIDAVGTTFNSSSATVTLPAGATVAYAGLYWGADTTAGNNGTAAPTPAANNTVRFNNGSGYVTVTASPGDVLTSTPQPSRYRGFANVTSLMTATGNGTYTVANIQAGDGEDRFAGWSMIIAYVDATLPIRRVSIWDGLGTVDATHTFSTNIAPFFTPATGTITSNIGLLSFEGDRGLATETMSFAGSNLTDAQNPANNQFNSTISTNGTLFTAKSPNYVNQMATDVDSYVRTGLLTNLQSSATLSFSSTQDYFMPSALFLVSDEGPSVNTSLPTIGGIARDGQVLTASPGTWLGTPTITYTYQWQRCDSAGANCVNVPGATGTTYTLTPADVGSTIRVVVTGNNDAGASAPASSNQTSTVVQQAPANVTLPQVNGVANDGETLTAGNGTWTGTAPLSFAYQWLRCDSAGNNCVNIAGATAGTYVLNASDVGTRTRVRVTASNLAGSAAATSPASAVTTADPPVNTVAPVISGTTQDGSTLGVNLGTWTGTSPLSYAYQWQRCDSAGANCVDVVGATSSTFPLTATDVGRRMRVRVTATNVAGSASVTTVASSTVTAQPPVNTVLPVISGTTTDGSTLSVNQGTWTGTAPISYGYQWQRCDSAGANCVDVAGATSTTFALTATDVGRRMRVRVTGTNVAGSASVTTLASSTVAALPPVNTVLPVISGTTTDGSTLSVNQGTWTGTAPISYGYQWQRCDSAGANCVDIAGETTSSHTLTASDVGQRLRVRVTGTNVAGSAPVNTAPSAVIAAQPPANTVAPVISGTTQDGSTLGVNLGTWTGTSPLSYAYQWQRCDSAGANCVDVAGATSSTFALTGTDVGRRMRVRVTATNVAGSASVTTAASSTVTALAPVNTVLPVVSGTTTDGSTLSVNQGTWTGTAPISYGYQWQRCDSAGANCVDIAGETGTSHVLTGADVGNKLRVRVTGTNVAGSSSVNTVPSSTVAAQPPANTTLPQVNGTTQDGDTLTASLGTWTGTTPLSYAYQWLRCDVAGANCVDIVGATAGTYDLTASDVGRRIRVRVTATNVAGWAVATSPASAVATADPPVNTTPPQVSGTTQDGSTLGVNLGTWTGTAPLTYTYQWERCDAAGNNCVDISGETGSTYQLDVVDVGSTIRIEVTATNAAGNDVATSVPSSIVAAEPPNNTSLPTVTGTSQDGETLSVNLGTWTGTAPLTYEYQWLRCDAGGANCVPIVGADNPTYDLTPADVGHTIRVEVTASNAAGDDTATSPASSLTLADPPVNTVLPAVLGTTQDGETLSADLGGWTGTAPLSYDYQWLRCDAAGANCGPIAGADDGTYDLAPADVGHTIRVEVTATNVAGDDTATSPPSALTVAEPPNNTTLPSVLGSTEDGDTLSVDLGTWTGTAPLTYDYQWVRCDAAGANCVDIVGADDPTYDLTPADIGSRIRVEITATNAAGDDTATSAPSSLVSPEPPNNTTPPSVLGSTTDGDTLTVDLGTWTGTGPLDYDYQWLRCDAAGDNCVPIPGATGDTYDLTPADVGSTIRVEVTASNPAGDDTATSAPSSLTLADPPVNTTPPAVLGDTYDGETLSVDLGDWTGTDPLDYDYQWLRCDAAGDNCVDIAGATGDTYDLSDDDVGSTIRVEVTATNSAGDDSATSAPSSLTLATPDPPVNTLAPSVLGSTQTGDTLTVDLGTWTGTNPIDYDYQWQRCDAAGLNCVPISGATDDSYGLTDSDIGHTIRVVVTATNVAGDDTASSTPTALVVAEPPNNTTPPQVLGTTQDGETLSVNLGAWTGTNPLDYDYQWQRCDALGANCVDISGATGDTYDLVPADIGSTIRIEVTATNDAGDDSAVSTPSSVVLTDPLVNTLVPTIDGEPVNGETLTANPGTWTGTGPIDFEYQWQSCDADGTDCVDIVGADQQTYEILPGDVGHVIRVVVTADNGTTPVTANSATTEVIGLIPPVSEPSDPPTLSGTTVVGDTLTADPGDWSGDEPIVLTYQWQRCDVNGLNCVDISGATDDTYDTTSGDVGHTIRVVVTGTNDAGSDSAASAPSAVITAVPVPDPDPDPDPDPPVVTTPPVTTTPPPVVPQSNVLADNAQLDDLGSVSGNLVAETSCQQLAGNSKYKRIKLKGIGTVRLRAYTSGPAMKVTPMQVSTQISGGKAKSVSYQLDGKALKAKKGPLYKATVTPAQLQRVGDHTLKAMVKGKKGKAQPVVLSLKTVPCKTLFTAQRWKTTAGAGLRLRIDARSALQTVSFKVPAGLLPKQTTKARKVGFVRFFTTGQPRLRFNLALPKKGAKAELVGGADKPSITYAGGGLVITGVPAAAAVAEITLYRENKLDKATKPKVFKLSAKVLRTGSGQESFSAKPKAPR